MFGSVKMQKTQEEEKQLLSITVSGDPLFRLQFKAT